MVDSSILRLGIFYDGAFFQRVSDYYLHHHTRHSRLSFTGLHDFLRDACATRMDTDLARTRVVEAHLYRGRLPTRLAAERDVVVGERAWDESLMYAGIEPHYLPLSVGSGGRLEEKGVDVALALDAYDLAQRAQVDLIVLIAGDGDFHPLLRRLHATGTAVLLPVWDVDYIDDRGTERQLRAAGRLRAEATWTLDVPLALEALMERDPARLSSVFVPRRDAWTPERAVTPVNSAVLADVVAPPAAEYGMPASQLDLDDQDPYAIDDTDSQTGTIATLKDGYGFLRVDGHTRDVFFHRSDVRNAAFSGLRSGMPVRFTMVEKDQGLVAQHLQVLVPVEAEVVRPPLPIAGTAVGSLWAGDSGYPL